MPVRTCTEKDVEQVADLCARACADDPFLGDLMHPKRKEFPDDFVDYFRQRLLRHIDDESHRHVVTFSGSNDLEVITGYADWVRQRAGDKDKSDVAETAGEPPVNRAADPAFAKALEEASVFTKHYWSGSRAENWYLDLLMVDPNHQRKGAGRELVRHGLGLAAKEGICASLIASEAGDGLYVSCGFTPVGWMHEGEGNPLRGVPGGRILFNDAPEKSIQT